MIKIQRRTIEVSLIISVVQEQLVLKHNKAVFGRVLLSGFRTVFKIIAIRQFWSYCLDKWNLPLMAATISTRFWFIDRIDRANWPP